VKGGVGKVPRRWKFWLRHCRSQPVSESDFVAAAREFVPTPVVSVLPTSVAQKRPPPWSLGHTYAGKPKFRRKTRTRIPTGNSFPTGRRITGGSWNTRSDIR